MRFPGGAGMIFPGGAGMRFPGWGQNGLSQNGSGQIGLSQKCSGHKWSGLSLKNRAKWFSPKMLETKSVLGSSSVLDSRRGRFVSLRSRFSLLSTVAQENPEDSE
jgi:hypothetical protein